MKKMIVIREGGAPDSRELDDYLYNSEVTRADFIDMSPVNEFSDYRDGLSIHVSEWDIVSKNDDNHDTWHVIADIDSLYAFNDRRYKALLVLEPYRSENCTPTVVVHKPTHVFIIYKVKKTLSALFDIHLKTIIESFNGDGYSHVLDEDAVGSLIIPYQKEEDVKHVKGVRRNETLE